jgi:hypothetical protein
MPDTDAHPYKIRGIVEERGRGALRGHPAIREIEFRNNQDCHVTPFLAMTALRIL